MLGDNSGAFDPVQSVIDAANKQGVDPDFALLSVYQEIDGALCHLRQTLYPFHGVHADNASLPSEVSNFIANMNSDWQDVPAPSAMQAGANYSPDSEGGRK